MSVIAAVLLGLAGVVAGAAGIATATVVGIPAAAILFIVAAVIAALAALFGIFAAIGEAQVGVLNDELNRARSDFSAATEGVMATCPVSCWGDLTMPSC